MRARLRGLLGLGLVLGLGTGPALARDLRLEVLGMAPIGAEGEAPPSNHAIVQRALAQAVSQVAASRADPTAPERLDPDTRWLERLGQPALAFTVRYRVLEDLGTRPPPEGLAAGPDALVRVLKVEVVVDEDRVVAAMQAAGIPVAARQQAPLTSFTVQVEGLDSWPALRRLRTDLTERWAATRVVPEQLQPGLARLGVEAPGGPEALLDRMLADPDEGLVIEPIGLEGGSLVLRISEPAPTPPPFDTPE